MHPRQTNRHLPERMPCPSCGKRSLTRLDPRDVYMETIYAVMRVCRSCGKVTGLRWDSL